MANASASASVEVNVQAPTLNVNVGAIGVSNEETEFHLCGTPYPVVSSLKALLVLIMNAGSPGSGTCIIGCLGKENINCYHFICMGILQLLLVELCCLGLIWSLCASCKFKELADIYENTGKAPPANLAVSWNHEAVSYRIIAG